MRSVTLMDLRHHLGAIVDEVRIKSEPVVLERAGRPVAMLCPLDYMETRQQADHSYKARALDGLEQAGRKQARASDLSGWLRQTRGELV